MAAATGSVLGWLTCTLAPLQNYDAQCGGHIGCMPLVKAREVASARKWRVKLPPLVVARKVASAHGA